MKINLTADIMDALVEPDRVKLAKKDAVKEQAKVNNIKNQTYVIGKESKYWKIPKKNWNPKVLK